MVELIKSSKYHRTIDGGELLRRREQRGWSQDEVADSIGVSRQFISRLESPGEDSSWEHEVTLKLAEQLEKTFRN